MELAPAIALEVADALAKWDDPAAAVVLDYLEELSGVRVAEVHALQEALPVLAHDSTGRPIREGQWLLHAITRGRSAWLSVSQVVGLSPGGHLSIRKPGNARTFTLTYPSRSVCIPGPVELRSQYAP